MKQLEIIEICSLNKSRELLEKQISELCDQMSAASVDVGLKVFLNGFIEGNFSIHLLYETKESNVRKSALGERLAEALRECGMVNHNVWMQRK